MNKTEQLREQLKNYCSQDVCVAFSGGVDSSLLLVMACEAAEAAGTAVYALTMDTVLHPKADLEIAKEVIAKTGAVHQVLTLDELAVPEIRRNPTDRCYLCKKELYTRMLDFAASRQVSVLLEGSNEDDLHVYRPGLLAVRELGVKSPLADCGITKAEVRALAEEYHIPVADRPSAPCLATRLPYGAEIDLKLLRRIDEAETYIRSLGYRNVRLRVHDTIARLEIDLPDFPRLLKDREKISAYLKKLGFVYITLDLEGFRSGSMDVALERV
ncbi:MAG: ATP-dependent sacrificial sulfur transferase LarE [Eubacteriales bacterium]|nr:ATP-dependent sacrificial sulfur transferase LarE [Eubacteriales bacterium]